MDHAYIGIDPGLKGAIAVIHNKNIDIIKMPTLKNSLSSCKIDADALLSWLMAHTKNAQNKIALIETPIPGPHHGFKAQQTSGVNYGAVLVILKQLNAKIVELHPKTWKAMINLPPCRGKTERKKTAISMAKQLFPEITESDDDIAEAALLAALAKIIHQNKKK